MREPAEDQAQQNQGQYATDAHSEQIHLSRPGERRGRPGHCNVEAGDSRNQQRWNGVRSVHSATQQLGHDDKGQDDGQYDPDDPCDKRELAGMRAQHHRQKQECNRDRAEEVAGHRMAELGAHGAGMESSLGSVGRDEHQEHADGDPADDVRHLGADAIGSGCSPPRERQPGDTHHRCEQVHREVANGWSGRGSPGNGRSG